MCNDGIDGSFQRANDGIQEPLDGIAIFPASRPVLPFESQPADHQVRQLTFISADRAGLRSNKDAQMLDGDQPAPGRHDTFPPKVIARESACSA